MSNPELIDANATTAKINYERQNYKLWNTTIATTCHVDTI